MWFVCSGLVWDTADVFLLLFPFGFNGMGALQGDSVQREASQDSTTKVHKASQKMSEKKGKSPKGWMLEHDATVTATVAVRGSFGHPVHKLRPIRKLYVLTFSLVRSFTRSFSRSPTRERGRESQIPSSDIRSHACIRE